MEGKELTQMLEKLHGNMHENAIRYMVYVLASALNELHKQGCIHRDVKSDNILCRPDGTIKLSDLGLTVFLSSQKRFAKSIKGTSIFYAPEIVECKIYTRSVDYWAFGCFMYEMANGRPPFTEDDDSDKDIYERILEEEVKGHPDRHEDFNDIMLTQLSKDSQDRISMEQVLDHKYIR